MPDIRRMGDDFVIVIDGRLYKAPSYDELYDIWKDSQK